MCAVKWNKINYVGLSSGVLKKRVFCDTVSTRVKCLRSAEDIAKLKSKYRVCCEVIHLNVY